MPEEGSDEIEWSVWQLVDSAFPSGGFVHSGGLESAIQLGLVRSTAQGVKEFARQAALNTDSLALPFVREAYSLAKADQLGRLAEVDSHFGTLVAGNSVAHSASLKQGLGFLAAATAAFGGKPAGQKAKQYKYAAVGRTNKLAQGHYPVSFGAVCGWLGIEAKRSERLFLLVTLRGILSAGVRLGALGTLEAQRVQSDLGETVVLPLVSQSSDRRSIDQAVQTSPLLDLAQGAHGRLYSRLFCS